MTLSKLLPESDPDFDAIMSLLSEKYNDEFQDTIKHYVDNERSSIMSHIDQKTSPIITQMLKDGIEPDYKTKGYLQALTEVSQWIGHRKNSILYENQNE